MSYELKPKSQYDLIPSLSLFSYYPIVRFCYGYIPSYIKIKKVSKLHLLFEFLDKMHCKSLWIKASAKCINGNVKLITKCKTSKHLERKKERKKERPSTILSLFLSFFRDAY